MFSLRLRCWLWEPSCWFLSLSFLSRHLPKESRFQPRPLLSATGNSLFVNIILITFLWDYTFLPHSSSIFLMIFGGLVLCFLAEKFVFADAESKSQIIVGLVLLGRLQLIRLQIRVAS